MFSKFKHFFSFFAFFIFILFIPRRADKTNAMTLIQSYSPKIIFCLSLMLFHHASIAAPTAAKQRNNENAFESAQKKYAESQTFTSSFSQTQTHKVLGTKKESLGRIFIKRPDKFLWQTESPDPSLMVSNGTKTWFYTAPFREGEKGQVLIKKSADVHSQLIIDLLSGTGNLKKSFNIKQLNPTLFELKPQKNTRAGDVVRIELEIEKSTNLVYKVTLFSSTGNQTALTLKDTTLGPNLSDKMFEYTPPPNTEVIE